MEELVRLELSAADLLSDIEASVRQEAPEEDSDGGARLQAALANAHTKIRSVATMLDDLNDRPSAGLSEDQAARHTAELGRLRMSARHASLRLQAYLKKRYAADRQALLTRAPAEDGESFASGLRRRKEQLGAASLLHKTQAVTMSLERTKNMMAMELERMEAVGEVLAEDSELLHKTRTQHTGYAGDVGQSRAHMAKLKRRQLTDKIVIGAGFAFFMCVVLYILKRRLWG